MTALDAEMAGTTALVADGNNASRTVLVRLLRGFGVQEVAQAHRAQDARTMLELRRVDIVVCEYPFEGEPVSGQNLVDDLRLAHILPLVAVVVMVSAEAGHAKVTKAAQAALDVHGRPYAKLSIHDGLKVKIAPVHSGFVCGFWPLSLMGFAGWRLDRLHALWVPRPARALPTTV